MEAIAWAAGLFEGEGTVMISAPGKNHGPRLEVSIANTDQDLLRVFQYHWSGRYRELSRRPNRKRCWQWMLVNQFAVNFLVAIRPYIRSRRQMARIDLARDFQSQKARTGNRLSRDANYKRVQMRYRSQMRRLNGIHSA